MGAASSSSQNAEDCLAEKPLKVTNLGDTASLKRCVDEASSLVVMLHGYDEDVLYSNIRIALGMIACIFALVAQFWPKPFPDNWNLLAACVVGYCIFSGALNFHLTFIERDAVLFTLPKKASKGDVGLKLSTQMKRYTDQVKIRISPKKSSSSRRSVEKSFSVARWFDSNGVMDKQSIKKDVSSLLAEYEAGGPGSEAKKSK